MIQSIYSTDGGSEAVLRFGKVFKIGELKDDFYSIDANGSMQHCSLVMFDFYEDGQQDYFFFSDENKLILSTVSEGRPDYLVYKYSELTKKHAGISVFVNVIRSEFMAHELFGG